MNEDSLIIYQDWFNNYWVNDRKVKFIYEYNKLKYNLFQYWNKDQATWIDEQRVTINYDTNDNVISNLVENHVGSEWIYSAKTIISYNDHQDPVTNIQQSWDTTNSSWINFQKTTFTYNSNFKRSKVCYQLWKNGEWETDINQTYIYTETRPETVPLLIEKTSSAITESFQLNQNYPNPFNPTTHITYQLKSVQNVNITVYDITGRKVVVLVNQKKSAGHHSVTFHGDGLSSGVYFYRLKAGDFTKTRKMILLK
jgi:hypothetical protein